MKPSRVVIQGLGLLESRGGVIITGIADLLHRWLRSDRMCAVELATIPASSTPPLADGIICKENPTFGACGTRRTKPNVYCIVCNLPARCCHARNPFWRIETIDAIETNYHAHQWTWGSVVLRRSGDQVSSTKPLV